LVEEKAAVAMAVAVVAGKAQREAVEAFVAAVAIPAAR